MSDNNIFVTKSFMPPINEYEYFLSKIWENGQSTNQGPLLLEFEKQIREYINVDYFHFVSNGTIALQLALRSLGITEGEVITTPFSYVATTSSIIWERCDPVFVDINPETLCLDANKIENVITDRTKAIMPVHVFGIPCDIERIEEIALNHNIKVIYDGAHAFGAKYKGRSLLDYGDITTCSFHSTKLFHTIEGGCIIVHDEEISNKIELIKRFGHNVDKHIMPGINGKASEFQAAMGLCNLKYINKIIFNRKRICDIYSSRLSMRYITPLSQINNKSEHNYSYYPIIFDNENELIYNVNKLNENKIYPRRYFYPSLNKLPYLKNTKNCLNSEDISKRIICLPLYDSLSLDDVNKICDILLS